MLKSFTHECLDLHELCAHNGISVIDALDALSNSDISYGTNADTLVHGYWLAAILSRDLDFGDHDEDILISIGS